MYKLTDRKNDIIIPKIHPAASNDKFERFDILGKGSYGTVYKASYKETNELVAIKKLNKAYIKLNNLEAYVKREYINLSKMNHPFVISLYHHFETDTDTFLVLEYCPLGELQSLVSPTRIDEHSVKFYVAEILLALEYMHSMNVMHRDLKPANILIDGDGHIRIADFGLSKEVCKMVDQKATLVGAPHYIAPEYLNRKKITQGADLYSLGIIMFELINGYAPYDANNRVKLFRKIKNGKLVIPKGTSVEATKLLRRLLHVKTEKRPSVEEVKRDPFFSGIDWDKLLAKEYEPPLKEFSRAKDRESLSNILTD